MYKLFIIGISEPALSSTQESLLDRCSLVVGTKRFKGLVDTSRPYLEISPLKTALTVIESRLTEGNVVVLASGDPLFYGIGRTLLEKFSKDQIEIYPALSSIQKACSLFKIPWDDAVVESLHGRKSAHIPGLLLGREKALLLTDSVNSPDVIAEQILNYLHLIGDTRLTDRMEVCVAEDIGLPSQKVFSGSLTETSRNSFSPLNIACLLSPASTSTRKLPYNFGLTEELITHSRGLITKNEVRAATLHQLQLPSKGVFWDVGAGSGSLSIEAARSNPNLTVYSFEHKAEEIQNIKNNIVKFSCYNIVPVFGRAPDSFSSVPTPDCIFVGGSSGSLDKIVAQAATLLPLEGRLVINGVIQKTIKTAPEIMTSHGFKVETSVVTVSRTGSDGKTQDFNPITIMTGTR